MGNVYGAELKKRRDDKRLTTRELGDRIDRSPTFITDFEIGRKSNPPEPEIMLRLDDVLGWPVIDQLSAWGYKVTDDPPVVRANPFEQFDLRWHVVEAMRGIDIDYEENEWLLQMMLRQLRSDEMPRVKRSGHNERTAG
jgi:transcriptional regulator with XRE-family HTH domain